MSSALLIQAGESAAEDVDGEGEGDCDIHEDCDEEICLCSDVGEVV